jgi:hypothetical protein
MTAVAIQTTPVPDARFIATQTGLVGYILFNRHIATSEAMLVNAFQQFQDAEVSDLILDLRYNGGGFLDIANETAYMIAGSQADGQTFDELEFNDKHTVFNPVTGAPLAPSRFLSRTRGFSTQAGINLPSMNLPRVFIITGPGTCSASEAIINGLRGIDVQVIQIGSATCGKPYGFYPFDNCGTTYFSIQFKGVNAIGFGDYTEGFSPANAPGLAGEALPGCYVEDDFSRPLGSSAEGRLAAALQHRLDGSCPPLPDVTDMNAEVRNRTSILRPSTSDDRIRRPFIEANRIMAGPREPSR